MTFLSSKRCLACVLSSEKDEETCIENHCGRSAARGDRLLDNEASVAAQCTKHVSVRHIPWITRCVWNKSFFKETYWQNSCFVHSNPHFFGVSPLRRNLSTWFGIMGGKHAYDKRQRHALLTKLLIMWCVLWFVYNMFPSFAQLLRAPIARFWQSKDNGEPRAEPAQPTSERHSFNARLCNSYL